MTFANLFALFFPLFSPLIFPSYCPSQPPSTSNFNLTNQRTHHISLLFLVALPSASPAAPKLLSTIW
jgi:hypothetical protein